MQLPPLAQFPFDDQWRTSLSTNEWVTCLDTWNSVISKHLEDTETAAKDESVSKFLATFAHAVSEHGSTVLGTSGAANSLRNLAFTLTCRLLASPSPPSDLVQWEFMADMCRLYHKQQRREVLLSCLSESAKSQLSLSIHSLKKFIIQHSNDHERHKAGVDDVDRHLHRVSFLIDTSPVVASYFMEGSDFLDALIEPYSLIHPSCRRHVLVTIYLCLVGLAKAKMWTVLTDHLYTLRAAAEKYEADPANKNSTDRRDAIVSELITSTRLLGTLESEIASAGDKSARLTSVLKDLATFRRPEYRFLERKRPSRLRTRGRVDKGKRPDVSHQTDEGQTEHIRTIQELFPEMGSELIAKFLDEHNNNVEQVIAHLLEDNTLSVVEPSASKPRSRPTPPVASSLPTRRNVFDGDEFDRLTESNNLTADLEKLRIGKRQDVDADTLLADRSKAPDKAAILSALAAFDADDDERDDTYDADDVGGTVDVVNPEEDAVTEGTEVKLYQAYMATPKLFGRDNATRRDIDRVRLRVETSMTDEAIEGWALMLERDPQKKKRLQARYGDFAGKQTELPSTAYRRSKDDGEDDEDEEGDGDKPAGSSGDRPRGGGRGGGGRGRGRCGFRGRGGGGGPPGSEHEKRQKEANKASRANHNRRDGRAKKLARGGGFPPQTG